MKIKKTCCGCKNKYIIAEMTNGKVTKVQKTTAYSYCETCQIKSKDKK